MSCPRCAEAERRAAIAEQRLADALNRLVAIAHDAGECGLTHCGWCDSVRIMRGERPETGA